MHAAMIAALYVVLLYVFQASSSSVIQVRVAEALTILPYFTPAAIPGVTLGCLIGNLLVGANIFDILFGTLATLIGTLGSYSLRKHKFLVCLPPIVSNTIIVPLVLRYAYGFPDAIPYMMLTVGTGEVISCGLLGTALLLVLEKYKTFIFNNK